MTAGPSVLELFAVDRVAHNVWRSRSCDPKGGRMYGGALAAQMMAAAREDVPGPSRFSSVDVRFVQPANGAESVDFEVERVVDGNSSAVRSVTMRQRAHTIAIGSIGLHTPRPALSHGTTRVQVDPEHLPRTGTPHPSRAITADAFDIRFHDEWHDGVFLRRLWFRAIDPLPDDTSVHECVLMYLSDIYFYEPLCLQQGYQGNDPAVRYGTTQHSVWFHTEPRVDEWMMIESRSPVLVGGRGLVYGQVRSSDGAPVATIVQEAFVKIDAAQEPSKT